MTLAQITPEELVLTQKRLMLARILRERRAHKPIEWYTPGYPGLKCPDGRVLGVNAGQKAFHESRHKYRVLAPGNGWGKSTAAGAEAHWWATQSHPFQPTPPRPVLMVWFVKLRAQFDLLRVQLREDVFGHEPVWKGGVFHWANGSTMHLASADRGDDWMKWQGVPVDLVMFDEEPPLRLWEEMTIRRRAKRKTRYVIAATATGGDSWMEEVLYKPWLEHHAMLGLDEGRAMQVQAYPSAFVWPRGGIRDNPAADADDFAHYDEATALMHPNERKVRLTGGFASWTGDPVFNVEAVEWLERTMEELDWEFGPGMLGCFEPHKIPRRAA